MPYPPPDSSPAYGGLRMTWCSVVSTKNLHVGLVRLPELRAHKPITSRCTCDGIPPYATGPWYDFLHLQLSPPDFIGSL